MGLPEFGNVVAEARRKRGLGLREVAREVGLEPSRLLRIERGDRPPPPLPIVRALAQVLGLPMGELLIATGTSREVVESLVWSERLLFGPQEAYAPHNPALWRRNTFQVEVVASDGALRTIALGEERLQVLAFGGGSPLEITVPPEAVTLHPNPPQALTAASVLEARVCKVRDLGDLRNYVLACRGFELNVLSVPLEEIAIEAAVWASFPVASVRTHPAGSETAEG